MYIEMISGWMGINYMMEKVKFKINTYEMM